MYVFDFCLSDSRDPNSVAYKVAEQIGDQAYRFAGYSPSHHSVKFASSDDASFLALRNYGALAIWQDDGPVKDFGFINESWPKELSEATTPASIREQFEKVKFHLVKPIRLTDRQIKTILRGRKNPKDPLFQRAMPIAVAEFTEAAQEIILRVARGDAPLAETFNIQDAFYEDMQAFNLIFFGERTFYGGLVVDTEHHPNGRMSRLHSDHNGLALNPIYAGRVGGLPMDIVKGRKRARLTVEQQALVERARTFFYDAKAKDELRKLNILTPALLNKVYLMLAAPNDEGTLHCSTIVPRGGVISGFLRAWGHFTKTPTP